MSAHKIRSLMLLAVCAACIAGCGGKPTGNVTGAVTLNGAPLKGGEVTAFNDKDEIVGSCRVIDGRYELSGIPVGAVTLVVQTHRGDGQPITSTQPPPMPGKERPASPPIPDS